MPEFDLEFLKLLEELDESVAAPPVSPQASALASALFIAGTPPDRIPAPAMIDAALALMDRASLPSPRRRRRTSADAR